MLSVLISRWCFRLSLLYLFIPAVIRCTPLNHNNNFVDETGGGGGGEPAHHQPPLHLATRVATPPCSVDHIVKWLNFGDLAELISKWADKENTRPMWVLEQLGNSIITSEQVHRLQKETGDESRHHHVHHQHRPSMEGAMPVSVVGDLPFEPPQGPVPISVFPPPVHVMAPPPFIMSAAMRPPVMATDLTDDQAAFIPLLPMGGLRPPPDAVVRIADGVFSTPLSWVAVTVTPRMSVAEALQQASARFTNGDAVDNEISWGRNPRQKCLSIRAIGNVEATDQFVWEVRVTDSSKQELWRSVCLPPLGAVQVRPSMTITLNYIAQEEAATD